MKTLCSCITMFLGMMLCLAQQNYTVEGVVKDFHDKTPLPQAEVRLGNQSVITNKNGYFILKNVPKSKYIVTASHKDCDEYTREVQVDRNTFLNIELEHHVHEIETVNLQSLHQSKTSASVSTLDKSQIDKLGSDNLGNIVSKISGVSALKTGNSISKPVIHGLYGSRVGVLTHGVKLSEQEWGVEHAPNVDVAAYDHIDVVKGASTLKYGNEHVGGIVLLEPAKYLKKDTLVGSVKFSAISNGRGGELSTNITKTWENQWFIKTGGSYRKLGDLYQPHATLQNTGSEVRSFHLGAGYQSFVQGFEITYSGIEQTFGIYKGAHLESPQDYFEAINNRQTFFLNNFSYKIGHPRQEVAHHLIKLSAYKRFSEIGKFTLSYSFQNNNRKEFDIRRGELADLPSMDLRLNTHTAQLIHQIDRAQWSLESGITGVVQDNFPNPATKARRLIPDYFRYDAGVFSVFKLKLNPRWDVEAGARYDFNRYDAYKYYDHTDWERYEDIFPSFVVSEHDSRVLTRPILDYHNISANLGLNYHTANGLELKANASRTDRAPNAAELLADGLHHSAAIMESGDLRLQKETVYQTNISLHKKWNTLAGLDVTLNPYLMYSKNFINQIPTGVKTTNRGVFPVWEFQQIEARIIGVDVDASLAVTENLMLTSSFSALRGDDLSNGEPLIMMMPTKWFNSLSYHFPKLSNLNIRLENENVWKQNRYPIRNQALNFIDNGQVVTKELDLSSTPKGFSIFNLGVGLDISKRWNTYLRINNILNTEYQEYLNRMRYFMAEPGRNFTLTITYKL